MIENRFIVEDSEDADRLDKYLAGLMPDMTRSYLQKVLKQGLITVNGKPTKPGYNVREDDVIDVCIPDAVVPEILPEDIPLEVLYEDSDVILVNKPKGMVVHPAPGHYTGTLVNGLMYHCRDLSGINGVLRPGIVHRIDMDTTGVLIVCKNDGAHNKIAAQLKEHSVNRHYKALVYGNLKEDEITVDAPLGRHQTDRKKMAVRPDGKNAVTHVNVLERFGDCTLVDCRLETGRTHQIRVHMASIGHPLVGDHVYGPASGKLQGISVSGLQGQTLHAYVLGFEHPADGRYVEVEAPLPEYFSTLLEKLRARGNK